MTLDADLIVERRRTRRKLTFWRAGAFVLLALIVIGLTLMAIDREGLAGRGGPQIARISISGVILEDRDLIDMIERIGEDDEVQGVLVSIDSPGGTTTGGEAIYVALRKLAEEKPVVTSVGTLCASAGYMIAIATDHIVAHRTSITGSIGVLFQYGNISRLLDTIGVEVNTIKSAPLKAEPSPFTPEVPGAKEAIASLVNDTFQWFVDIVAERRGYSHEEALKLADGRVYSGRQALDLKLIDEIGGEEQAIDWLEAQEGVDADLPVRDWKPGKSFDGFSFFDKAQAYALNRFGIDTSRLFEAKPALDGLVSLWHPQVVD